MNSVTWLDRINPQVHNVGHAPWRAGTVEASRILYNHQFVAFIGGGGWMVIGGERYACHDGTFMIVPPGVEHATSAGDRPVHRYWIHFDWKLYDRQETSPLCVMPPAKPARHLLRPTPSFVPKGVLQGQLPHTARVIAMLRDMAVRWYSEDGHTRSTCRAMLLELVIMLFAPARDKSPDRRKRLAVEVKQVLDSIAVTGGSVQEKLAAMGYSYEHLCRLFRDQFGITPTGYVNAARIARARQLLADPRLSIAQVAFESGFADPGYFARVFRQAVGVSPTQYLRDYQTQAM